MPYLTPQEQKVLIVVMALLVTGFIVKPMARLGGARGRLHTG